MKDSEIFGRYIRNKAIDGLRYLDSVTCRKTMSVDLYDINKLRDIFKDILFVGEKLWVKIVVN